MPALSKKRPAMLSADRAMFPLATVFAAAAIGAWLVLRDTSVRLPTTWHGHEILFGYALAVVAGFLVTKTTRSVVLALLVTWLAARMNVIWAVGAWGVVGGLSFGLALLAAAAPPLWRGAKRGENRIAPVVLFVLVALDGLWWAGASWFGVALQQRALLGAIDTLALLMLVIGGRALPAAVGGYFERHGLSRADMIRSGYELPLAALMGGACAADVAGLPSLAGLLNIAAALVTVYRATYWRLRHAFKRVELWSLAVAYLWLVPALVLKGIAQLMPVMPAMHLLHAFSIGALGSLTLVMMARTAWLRARRPLRGFGDIGAAVLLVSASALLRLVASPTTPARELWLWSSAGTWMVAFAIVLVRLMRAMGGKT